MARKKMITALPAGTYSEASSESKAEANVSINYHRAKDLHTLPERIAGDKTCIQNWFLNEVKSTQPTKPWMWCVDLYFPYASGGPLMMDFASITHAENICIEKAKIFKTLGFRYAFITQNMGENDVLMQLES